MLWASSSTSATAGMAGDDRVGVHLLHGHAPVLHAAARDHLEAVEQRGGVAPAVRLHEPDHNVRAAVVAAVRLLEHLERLADAGRHAHVDPQPPALGPLLGVEPGQHLVAGRPAGVGRIDSHFSSPSRSRFNSRTFTFAAPMKPRNGWLVWRATTARTASSVMPRALATRATW